MARYRIQNAVTNSFLEVFTTNISGLPAPTATDIFVNNADGTISHIVGVGLTLSGGVATGGTITSITRTNAAQTIIYEIGDQLDSSNNSFVTFWNASGNGARFDYVTAGSDNGFGSSGVDHFNLGLSPSGPGGSNSMTGFGGNDTFEDGGGYDFINYSREQTGGATQNVIVNFSNAAIMVGAETVQAKTARDAYGFTDTFIGSIEAASGTNLADTFVGDDGNNQFRPFGGNDTVDGGAGFDEWAAVGTNSTAPFDPGAITATYAAGTAMNGTINDGLGGTDTFTSIERIRGTNFNDTFNGNDGNNSFRGLGGADTFNGGAGFDETSYSHDDSYGGSNGVIVNLSSSAINATIGAGTFAVGAGQARDGFGNIDTLNSIEKASGTGVADYMVGSAGNNFLYGDDGADTLLGGLGNDTLQGGFGADVIDGGGGWDIGYYATTASTGQTITKNIDGSWNVNSTNYTNVEVLRFTDRDIAIREATRSDTNGNGTSDMVLQSGGTVVAWNVSNGVAQSGTLIGGGVDGWTVQGTGDFNGDGTTDVILQNGGTVVQWSMNNGANAGGTLVGAGIDGWTVKGTGDFNSDGTTDVVLQNGGTVVAWTMQNGVAASGVVVGSGVAGWDVVGTGDFNGDGASDILLQNGGTLVAWNMRNGQNIGGSVLAAGIDGWQVVGTGDFNGDGTTDVVVKNGGTIVDLLVQNSVATTGNVIGLGLEAWDVVATGDYNGDGTADIALTSGGFVVDWTMQNGLVSGGNVLGGNGTFSVVA